MFGWRFRSSQRDPLVAPCPTGLRVRSCSITAPVRGSARCDIVCKPTACHPAIGLADGTLRAVLVAGSLSRYGCPHRFPRVGVHALLLFVLTFTRRWLRSRSFHLREAPEVAASCGRAERHMSKCIGMPKCIGMLKAPSQDVLRRPTVLTRPGGSRTIQSGRRSRLQSFECKGH